jgi:C_GCAxxG_C_C family probable redox protein
MEPDNSETAAIALARSLFLRDDSYYGCAETSLVTLQEVFGLPNPTDSSSAVALNGGIAYSGGMCGALTGAAMALGRLAEQRISDHRQAKSVARTLTQNLIGEFEEKFSSHNCSDLIDYDISIPEQHDAFIEDGKWRDTCMRQIEFAVSRLHHFADETTWKAALPESPSD